MTTRSGTNAATERQAERDFEAGKAAAARLVRALAVADRSAQIAAAQALIEAERRLAETLASSSAGLVTDALG